MNEYEGPRCIEESELPELIQLLNLVFRPHGGDMGREYPRHVALSNRENVRIVKQNGKIVSHVATSIRPVSLGGIQTWEAGIGAVATHPDGRGKGYASILMQDAVRRSVERGADIMLISGDLGVYRRMHAVDCGTYPVMKVPRNRLQPNSAFSISPAQDSDIDSIISLWKTLPTRYMLPREDWVALSQCRHVMDKPSDWWMVRWENVPVGFGIVHKEGSDLWLLDWAGHPDALEAAAAFWIDRYQSETLVYISVKDNRIPISWKQWIEQTRSFYGTVLVIDSRRFLLRARPFLEERIGTNDYAQLSIQAEKQSVCFELDDERVEFVNGGELALLFFGHPTEDIVSKKMPDDSKLRSLLMHMFPVPLVWYGIGYV